MPDTDEIINLDALIAAVAKKHGFILSGDDPILATVYLNRLVLEGLINSAFENLEVKLDETYHRQSAESTATSKKIMAATFEKSSAIMETKVKDAADKLAEKIQLETDKAVKKIQDASKEQRRMRDITIVFGCIAAISAITGLLALFLA